MGTRGASFSDVAGVDGSEGLSEVCSDVEVDEAIRNDLVRMRGYVDVILGTEHRSRDRSRTTWLAVIYSSTSDMRPDVGSHCDSLMLQDRRN